MLRTRFRGERREYVGRLLRGLQRELQELPRALDRAPFLHPQVAVPFIGAADARELHRIGKEQDGLLIPESVRLLPFAPLLLLELLLLLLQMLASLSVGGVRFDEQSRPAQPGPRPHQEPMRS